MVASRTESHRAVIGKLDNAMRWDVSTNQLNEADKLIPDLLRQMLDGR
jgi:hypothetical protein